MRIIDLRSDTVTRPTPAMREAMLNAEVGDDVYGDDPSVGALQETTAHLLGKEVALFFPSGTMANQACLRLHTRPGDAVLASRDCHILRAESGAAAGLSGLEIHEIGRGGVVDGDDVRAAIHPDDPHVPPTTLLALENTHNFGGGRVLPAESVAGATAVAREAGLATHLDGARLFNAAVASGQAAAELAAPFDTVSICLSKGLGAPVGSVVATARDRLPRLRRIRKMLGGGMRQAGFLAAAGSHALAHHVERLAEDHANAARLAEGLASLGFEIVLEPETNLVPFRVPDAASFYRTARERGVWLNPSATGRFRAVTHLDVTSADIDEALERLSDLAPR